MTRIVIPNNWRPRPYQMAAWSYLENGGRHAELCWHRRSGKDEVSLHRTAVAAFERPATYWYMLPKYNQARKAIWAAVNPHTGKRRIDEVFPKELRSGTREQEMSIPLKNGSTWQVVGSDNPDSLVGAPPAGIVYSEWALSNPECRAYLRPIILENNGWQIFNGTPRGRNHAYKTLKAAEKTAGSFAQVLSALQTGTLTQKQLDDELQAYINDFGEDYGRSKFEQEYLCSFDAANMGAILARALGVSEHRGYINDEVLYDPYGAPIEISCDLGRRDTATWYFWQPTIGGYKIVDHMAGFGIDAEEWSERLNDRLKRYRNASGKPALGRIWMPHDARAKTFSAKHSAVEIFLSAFGSDHVAMVPRSSIADRVNAARVVVPFVKFHATNCEIGLDGLRAWSYEYDAEKRMFSSDPVHDWSSHEGDGFSYGCLIMQHAAPPAAKQEDMRGLMVGSKNTVTLEEMWASAPRPTQERI
jgi:phage terminase large subunit